MTFNLPMKSLLIFDLDGTLLDTVADLAASTNYALSQCGFPIHDRFGGQRIMHVGYRGTQQLLDTIVNTILERRQDSSPIGYSYM